MPFDARLTVKQAETVRRARDARIAVWEGSVRSSKTVVSIIAFVEHVVAGPPGAMLMAGRTTDTLRRNVLEPMIDMFGSQNVKPVYGAGTATIFGRTVHLVGVDNAAAESRIRGLTLAGAYVDEVTVLAAGRGQEWWQQLLARCSVAGAKVYGTTNPDSPSHWFHGWLERAEWEVTQQGTVRRNAGDAVIAGFHRYRFTIGDNPHLPSDYVDSLKASLSGVFYDRFIEGRWVVAEGAVYPMLELSPKGRHVVSVSPATLRTVTRWTVGIDWGVTNPTAAILVGVTSENRILVASEMRIEDGSITVAEQVRRVSEWIAGGAGGALPPGTNPDRITIVVDPSARAFRNEWRSAGYRWPTPANNSVLEGISDVSSLAGSGRLLFSDVLLGSPLFRELEGYVWDEKATDRGSDAPVKADDHSADALRYAVRHLQPVYKRWLEAPKPEKKPLDRALAPW